MLKPRYYFADDFRSFYEYFLSQPHTKRIFQKGDYLWKPGQPYDRVQYYVSGASVHFSDQGRFSPVITQMTSVLSRL